MARHIGTANLIPVSTHEQAVALAKKSAIARKKKAQEKELLFEDMKKTMVDEIDVPASLYEPLKKFGIAIKKRERISKILFFKSLFKAIKDGNVDPLLKIAEFVGWKEKPDLKIKAEATENGGGDNGAKSISLEFEVVNP